MKRMILILFVIFFGLKVFSQNDINDTTIYNFVDMMPQFVADDTELAQFIFSNLLKPDANCFVTYIILNFVIEKDGSISNKMVVIEENYINLMDKGVFAECKQAWIVSSMQMLNQMPNWKPGMQNGKFVRVRYSIPVRLDFN